MALLLNLALLYLGMHILCCNGLLLLPRGSASQSHRRDGLPIDDAECLQKALAQRNLSAIQTQITFSNSSDGLNNVIEFRLYNPAIDVSTECAGHGAALSPTGPARNPDMWYWCFVESRDSNIAASFRYDTVTNRLTVNETWICKDQDTGRL